MTVTDVYFSVAGLYRAPKRRRRLRVQFFEIPVHLLSFIFYHNSGCLSSPHTAHTHEP